MLTHSTYKVKMLHIASCKPMLACISKQCCLHVQPHRATSIAADSCGEMKKLTKKRNKPLKWLLALCCTLHKGQVTQTNDSTINSQITEHTSYCNNWLCEFCLCCLFYWNVHLLLSFWNCWQTNNFSYQFYMLFASYDEYLIQKSISMLNSSRAWHWWHTVINCPFFIIPWVGEPLLWLLLW